LPGRNDDDPAAAEESSMPVIAKSQLIRDFHEHPHSVGETYLQHWCSAMGFALSLVRSALACALHAFVPGLCKTTASETVTALHRRMVTHRHRQARDREESTSAQRATA
jgi:hypothetical protein